MDLILDPIVLIPIAVVFTVAMIVGRNEIVKRKLRCPHTNEVADVDVARRSLRPSKLVRVESCSLLPDPKHVDCDQECLKQGA